MEIPDEKFNNLGGLKPGGCQQTPEYYLHLIFCVYEPCD